MSHPLFTPAAYAMEAQKVHSPCGQVVRHVLTLLFLMLATPSAVMAETVPALPPPPTAPSVGGWYLHTGGGILYPPFPGAPTGQAFCDYWKSSLSNNNYSDVTITFLPTDSGYGGLCTRPNPWGPGVVLMAQTGYIEYCPPGYTSPAAGGIYPQTCTNVSADNRCPAVATGETPFKLDLPNKLTCSRPDQCQPPGVTDPATGQCVKCPIDPLPDLPDEACTISLEAGGGKDVNNACSSKLTDEMKKQAQCLADKIHKLGISYTEPSATIRTEAYQQHLLDVWNWMQDIKSEDLSNVQKTACTKVITDVYAHQKKHGIISDPSKKGNTAPHVIGKAVDIPSDVASAVMDRVTDNTFITFNGCVFCIPISITTIGDTQDYVNDAIVNPPPCNLIWGGRFKRRNPDNVHFQLP